MHIVYRLDEESEGEGEYFATLTEAVAEYNKLRRIQQSYRVMKVRLKSHREMARNIALLNRRDHIDWEKQVVPPLGAGDRDWAREARGEEMKEIGKRIDKAFKDKEKGK